MVWEAHHEQEQEHEEYGKGLHVGGGGDGAPSLALALYDSVLLGDALQAIRTERQAQRRMRRRKIEIRTR